MPGFFELIFGGIAAGVGFAVGVGGTLAGGEKLKPVAKEAMKGYLAAVDRAREATAGFRETVEDLYAEAKSEYQAKSNSSASEPGNTAS